MNFDEWWEENYGEYSGQSAQTKIKMRMAYDVGVEHQQAKVEELQKRVDKALELMQKPVIVGEPAKYVCSRFKEIEQALKGEGQ
ncbi:hypothetical protein J658_0054 [Acinetobacter baumannii 573719]|nr:hypothetical protein J658_0054 [Acinetobacter baumannii 573719]